MRPTTVQA